MVGNPKCLKCLSEKFKSLHVSTSFLRKLKVKPGIGRSLRYKVKKTISKPAIPPLINEDSSNVTLEQIFQLNREQIKSLFDQNIDEKKCEFIPYRGCKFEKMLLKSEDRDQEVRKNDNVEDCREWLKKSSTLSLRKNTSISSLYSRKPLNCPHDPCKKIIAISSFYSHFKYDHPEITRYAIERGKDLCLPLDISKVEHNKTICFGLITVYDKFKRKQSIPNMQKLTNQRIPVDTFWIMLSGSPEETPSHAYMLVWLFTNNDEYYNCTIEISSKKDIVCYSTFCGVNDMHDSQNIVEIAQRLNCLYLSYGSMKNLLQYGSDIQLRIAIH